MKQYYDYDVKLFFGKGTGFELTGYPNKNKDRSNML